MMNSKLLYFSRQNFAKQTGATLIVALMFLLIMTLFAVSSINMSTINLRIIGNMQATKTLDATAQDLIEQLIGTASSFTDTPTNTLVITEYDPVADNVVTTNLVVGTHNSDGLPTPTYNTLGNPVQTALGTIAWVEDPECVDSVTAKGYTALNPALSPSDNTWEVVVHLTDGVTGASSVFHQGTQVRMLAGNCPD